MRKDIITSKDRMETRDRVWALMREGFSKSEIYKKLEPEYLSKYELALTISTTPNYEELPEFQRKNRNLFILLCVISVIKIIYAVILLCCYGFALTSDIENKAVLSIFIILIFIVPIIPVWLAVGVKRMDRGIYLSVVILSLLGIGQLFKKYPETSFGWIFALIQLSIIMAIGILSFKIYKKYICNKISLKKDNSGNYIFNQ